MVKATASKSKFLEGYFADQLRIKEIRKRLGEISRDDYRDWDYQDRLEEEYEELQEELMRLTNGC